MVTVTRAEAQQSLEELLDTAQREPVSIVRPGAPEAFLISKRDMEEILNAKARREEAVKALEAWYEDARPYRNPNAEELTDEEIVRLVHELR